MAFIPDEAVDRMTELSAGAWRLYCYLARCRNQKTGKCNPSASTIARVLDMERRHVFRLKTELSAVGWATFDGGDVTALFGFGGDNIVTTTGDKKATVKNVTSDQNVTPRCQKSHQVVTKKSLTYKEEPAKNQQIEPAKDNARPNAVPVSVAYIRQLTHRFPDRTLWPRIVQTLGEDFDQGRLTECYENWVSHGWNKMNLVWLFEWYTQGIPENRSGHGGNNGRAKTNQADGDKRTTEDFGIRDCKIL